MGGTWPPREGMGDDEKPNELDNLRKMMNYALIKNCDMNEEMRQDCVDLVITASERYQNNFEAAARLVKETMDKKYNESWVVIIGEGFGFEVTHEVCRCDWFARPTMSIICDTLMPRAWNALDVRPNLRKISIVHR